MPGPSRAESGAGHGRGRLLIGIAAVVLVVLAMSMRALATFWTDYLWFESLDLTSVWTRLISARVTLGAATGLVFFALMWSNLIIADRLAPRFRSTIGPDDDLLVRYREVVSGRQRLVWLTVSVVMAAVPAFSASAQWRDWLLFRFGGSFGATDPQFGKDLSWYVFRLPFLSAAVDWLFAFLVVTVIAVAVVHYLNGAIRMQPLGERVTPNAKAHLSILLALAAFAKAADYWLRRFELVVSGGQGFDGAGYTDVNAALPAIDLMILISVFAAVLLLVNIRRRGWTLPVIILALWALTAIIAGGIYPAFVQRFQVDPNELPKERPYVERNMVATREAYGLGDVDRVDFAYDPELEPKAVAADPVNLDNARLLDPTIVRPTIQELQVEREYYTFRDVDVDRYQVDDEQTPVVISSRELYLAGVSNASWEKLHLVFTHGYAAAMAPANTADEIGEPEFLVKDIPPVVSEGLPPLLTPELYHGEGMEGYAIVGTEQTELSDQDLEASYEGDTAVSIGSTVRQAAFALRFGEIEPLISDSITGESKVIYIRDVVERVKQVAPYLDFDPDPYPILVDGRVKYVVDAYTVTPYYPYSQHIDASEVDAGSGGSFNYIRNSAKAVVDAYDGTVDLYLTDELGGQRDPIIRAYAAAFPDLFADDIPDEVMEHFRYPEFMFKVQTHMWGSYHQEDPSTFFNSSDRWIVSPAPSDVGAAGTGSAPTDTTTATPTAGDEPIEPYYQQMKIGTAETAEFVLTRPFVLASSDNSGRNLTSIMIARNDPSSYGRLEEIVMVTVDGDDVTRNNAVDGPIQANRRMMTNAQVAEYQNFVGDNGSRVRFGNILILPVENSLVYLRPIYAAEENSSRFTLQRVVVASGEEVGFGQSVEQALADMLDRNPDAAVDAEPEEPGLDDPGGGSPVSVPPGSRTPTELLADADRLFTRAEERLGERDLAGYDELVQQAIALVREANRQLAAEATGGATTTTTTPATTTTTGGG